MTILPVDQRTCSAYGSRSYSTSAVWNFEQGPRCICISCYNKGGYRFNDNGDAVRSGSRLASKPVEAAGKAPKESNP